MAASCLLYGPWHLPTIFGQVVFWRQLAPIVNGIIWVFVVSRVITVKLQVARSIVRKYLADVGAGITPALVVRTDRSGTRRHDRKDHGELAAKRRSGVKNRGREKRAFVDEEGGKRGAGKDTVGMMELGTGVLMES
jgi:hypothetical protein